MPIHRHDEFGRPGLHWHVDYRYLAGEPSQSRVVWPETDDPDGEVKYVRMARIRETYTAEMQIPHIQAYLSGRFGGVSVGADGVCPHKGLPMMPVGPSGHRRCVGHGLTCDPSGHIVSAISFGIAVSDKKFVFNSRLIDLVQIVLDFPIDRAGEIDSVDVTTPDGCVIGSLKPRNRVYVRPGDSYKVTIGDFSRQNGA